MLIYDPVSNFLSDLIARQHRYKCVVDGRDEEGDAEDGENREQSEDFRPL